MTGDFGRYKILFEIGRGGMGIVYQALDRKEKELVAIKQLVFSNIDPAKEKEFRDRFKREAATAKRLEHPNIVHVHDINTEGENFFYVMEFLEGHSLRREFELRGGRLAANEFWPILKQTAEGLSFAHTMNVVHRDVKPDNIFLLKDGRVKITDFGIATGADYEQTHLTKTGVMMGTLAYVSPEQLQDAKNVDHRADVFSLGVVCYEALSGQVPFAGDGIAQTIVKIVSQEEKPLHILVPTVSVETSTAVMKALRKRARERYRSVKDFARDFENSLSQSPDAVHVETIQQITNPHASMVTEAGAQPEMEDVKELRQSIGETLREPMDDAMSAGGQQTGKQDRGGQVPDQRVPFQKGTEVQSKDIPSKPIPGPEKPLTETPVPDNPVFDRPVPERQALPKPGQFNLAPGVSEPLAMPAFSPRPQTPAYARAAELTEHESKTPKPFQIIDSYSKEHTRFAEPAIVCYRSGRLIIADTAMRKVHMFTVEGRWMGELTNRADSLDTKTRGGQLTKPSGIAIDSKGRIYVCDGSDPFVRVFDSRGVFMKELRNIQSKDGGIQGIALDSTGLLYLSDVANQSIQVFQSDLGLWMRTITSKGDREGQMQLPAGLTIDRLNQIYCADYGASRIWIFNKSGSVVRSFGGKGTGPGLFNVPRAVAVDKNDKIYVVDSLNHRIQIFGPTGEWFSSFGGRGTEPGKFITPSDLTMDLDNNVLYVADKGNQRVQLFEINQT